MSKATEAAEALSIVTEAATKEIAALKAQLATAQSTVAPTETEARELYLAVSVKGAVSLYGIRRFPITFYLEEWAVILTWADRIVGFIKANRSQLRTHAESKQIKAKAKAVAVAETSAETDAAVAEMLGE